MELLRYGTLVRDQTPKPYELICKICFGFEAVYFDCEIAGTQTSAKKAIGPQQRSALHSFQKTGVDTALGFPNQN